jgi:hypothetical protein
VRLISNAILVRGLILLLLVGGCDMLFQLDHVGPIDAPVDVMGGCVNATLDDHFAAAVACEPWGTKYENKGALVVNDGNQLTIQPATVMDSSGGCASKGAVAFGAGGVAVEVSDVLSGNQGEYTELHLYEPDLNAVSIGVTNNILGAGAVNLLYDPTAMRWWRLRPVGNAIEAAYTADGENYMPFSTIPLPPPATFSINLIGGLGGSQTGFGGLAVFRRLLVCP